MERLPKRIQTHRHIPKARSHHATKIGWHYPGHKKRRLQRRHYHTYLTDNIKVAVITPHDGTPIIAITEYMPQLHKKTQEQIYLDILKRVKQDILHKYKDTTILMGGYLQATPAQENERSYYPPLNRFCETTSLTQLTPKDAYTFIPAKTHIDH